MSLLSDTIDLLTFRAFEHEADDYTVPMRRRLAGKKSALIAVGPYGVQSCVVTFSRKGVPSFSDISFEPLSDGGQIDSVLIGDIAENCDCKHAILQTAVGWDIDLVVGIRNMERSAELTTLLTRPKNLIQMPNAERFRHALLRHSNQQQALHLHIPQDKLRDAEADITSRGIQVVRTQCSTFSLLELGLKQVSTNPDFDAALIVDHGNGFYLQFNENEWLDRRRRFRLMNPAQNNPKGFISFIQDVRGDEPGGKKMLVVDGGNNGFIESEELLRDIEHETYRMDGVPGHLLSLYAATLD